MSDSGVKTESGPAKMVADPKQVAREQIPHDAPKPNTVWRHYKGGLYTVHGTGLNEDTLEPMVAYTSAKHGTLWFRTLTNWREQVQIQGAVYAVPRFVQMVDVAEVA